MTRSVTRACLDANVKLVTTQLDHELILTEVVVKLLGEKVGAIDLNRQRRFGEPPLPIKAQFQPVSAPWARCRECPSAHQ